MTDAGKAGALPAGDELGGTERLAPMAVPGGGMVTGAELAADERSAWVRGFSE